jgi:hypothetical protein
VLWNIVARIPITRTTGVISIGRIVNGFIRDVDLISTCYCVNNENKSIPALLSSRSRLMLKLESDVEMGMDL